MTDIAIAELEDARNTVYALGLSASVSESVTDYLYSPEFDRLWSSKFDHADYILIPGEFDGIVQIEGKSVEEVKEAFEEVNEDVDSS
jgi:hypothetical protein